MRNVRTALLGGITAIGLAGLTGAAVAQSIDTHVMAVRLPDGGIAEIQHTGNVPPQVSFASGRTALATFDPIPAMFGPGSIFATMQRISAAMDREVMAMFGRPDSLAAEAQSSPAQLTETMLRNLPPGSASYSFMSTMSRNGACTKSFEITSPGNGGRPRVVSHSSGNCGAEAGTAGSVNLPVARPPVNHPRPDLILTRANGPRSYAGMIRKVADAER